MWRDKREIRYSLSRKRPRKTVMKKGRGVETSWLNFALICACDKEINGI